MAGKWCLSWSHGCLILGLGTEVYVMEGYAIHYVRGVIPCQTHGICSLTQDV